MEGEGDERQALMEDLLEQKGEKFVEGAIVEDGQLLDASEAETRYFQGTEGLVKVFVRQGTLLDRARVSPQPHIHHGPHHDLTLRHTHTLSTCLSRSGLRLRANQDQPP